MFVKFSLCLWCTIITHVKVGEETQRERERRKEEILSIWAHWKEPTSIINDKSLGIALRVVHGVTTSSHSSSISCFRFFFLIYYVGYLCVHSWVWQRYLNLSKNPWNKHWARNYLFLWNSERTVHCYLVVKKWMGIYVKLFFISHYSNILY